MKNKSVKTNELQKRDSATRSAGKQATGNRNKHLLAAERRRTDEADGRLNKQNPVSPQNDELNKSKDNPSKTQALRKSLLKRIDEAFTELDKLRFNFKKNIVVKTHKVALYQIDRLLHEIWLDCDNLK